MSTNKSKDAAIVELYDNPLTQRADDRYGRVLTIASVDADVLIARAIENGFAGNAASMKAAYEAIVAEAKKAVARGESVHIGLGYASLDVEGRFIGDTPEWDPKTNRLVCHLTPDKDLREALQQTPVKVIGMAPSSTGIESVTDVSTGEVNTTLTPGGMANVVGKHIKIAGDDPQCGLFLANLNSSSRIAVPPTAIGTNNPSSISFVVPLTIAAGDYQLEIVTQYMKGTSNRKEPRTFILKYPLVVLNVQPE